MTASTQRRTVSADGYELNLNAAYRAGGDELILMLHGLGCSHRSFLGAWRSPKLSNYSLLAPDFPGFGLSDKPSDFSYELSEQATLVARLLEHYPDRPIHILAHSMGGAVALLLPPSLMARARTLISVEGNLVSEDCDMFSRKIIRKDFDVFRERYLPKLTRNLGELGTEHADMERADPLAIYSSAHSLVRNSESRQLLARFSGLDCRRAYIYGEENAQMPVLKALDSEICHEIPGCGHFPMNDAPEAFYSLVADLLGSQPPVC